MKCILALKEGLDKVGAERYGFVPKADLRQAAPNRWVSGTATIERFLVHYEDLVKHYAEHEGREMDFHAKSEVRVVCDV